MATTTQNTSGGTTTSFSNTPQAVDDTYSYSASASGIIIINVMANDLGGAAKSLWSLDNDTSALIVSPNGKSAPADLLTKDTVYATTAAGIAAAEAAASTDTSLLGAKIWINSDGTVSYDASSISATLQAVAAGDTLTDYFTYAIRLGNGTLSWATTKLTFGGVNDSPVVAAALTATAAEGSASFTKNLLTGASDVDHGETATLTVTNVSYVVDGGPSSLTAPAGVSLTGSTLTIDPTNTAVDHLAVGQHQTIVVSYDVMDVHGVAVHQTETITVTGTNDAPVVTGAVTGSATEDGASSTLNALANASDVRSEAHTSVIHILA